ncbi:hypothetical protein BGZ63DRAFT_440538 [Mariannaea sp. PMI_226]|nr:hypothetical protein BGZ63DRAFT_440538 [Mariannaea sp. PMI_226]
MLQPLSDPARARRISLACVQCRSRHVKCDKIRPICSYCQVHGSECTYRTRRHRQTKVEEDNVSTTSSPLPRTDLEPLIELYYRYFHGSHPCALPAAFLRDKITEDIPGMSLLVSVMRFIGSLFTSSVPSGPLEDELTAALSQRQPWTSGFEIQALILYSIAAFWCDKIPLSEELLMTAIIKAVSIGMNTRMYAVENSGGDPIMAESWRRTWWQIYIADLHIAATNHKTEICISRQNISADVDLPCEEDEYNSGRIPEPRTMEEYDNREFASDEEADFSSYAYLIGLLKSFDRTIFGIPRDSEANVRSICSNTDASNAAWMSLLPKRKRKLFREDGKVDELLFKASTLLQAYTIDIHRQLSKLKYSPIESVSSCSPRPPPDRLAPMYYREAHLHTAKILCAIERMTDLLTLPTDMTLHTPFTICMTATITIAHLSACKFVFKGRELDVARERIRLAIGALESFGEIWPRAKKVVREIKAIARDVLHLGREEKADAFQDDGSSSVQTSAGSLSQNPVDEVDYFSSVDLTRYLGYSGDFSCLGSSFDKHEADIRSPFSLDIST